MTLSLDKSAWKRVAFGDVVRNVNETVRDLEAAGIDRIIAMEHMDPGELKISRWGSATAGTTFTRRVKSGQTLFGKRRAYQRKVAYAEFDAVCSSDIYTFEADETRILGEFLPFLVQSDGFFNHALGTSAGSLSPRTNWRDLATFEFDLPPLEEQRRIAALAWAIEHRRTAIAAFPELLRAAYDTWLERRLTDIPTKPLAEVFELQHGRPVPSSLYGAGKFPLLRPGDMNSDGSVTWSSSSVQIPSDFVEKYPDWVLNQGDLVINMTAQTLEDRFLGRVCRMREGALLNQRIGRLSAIGPITAGFAFVALRSAAFSEWVARRAEGSKVKHLHWRHIADYPMPVPTTHSQESIISEASYWSDSMQRANDELSTLNRLHSSVLAAVFGGN